MKNYIEIIKTLTENDFTENIANLHMHTTFSDGKGDIKILTQQAKDKGYKHIAFCDHNTLEGYRQTDILNEDIVIPAIEFDCWCSYVFLHLLGYGIDVNNQELLSFCAKSKKETEADIVRIFAKRHPKDLIKAIHNAGGIAVLAHPCCCWTHSLDWFVKKLINYGLDGIEVYYPYDRHRGIIKFHSRHTAENIANKYNLIKTGGTDLHSANLWVAPF